MTRYTVLRTWAVILKAIGAIGMVLAGVGVILVAIEADGFASTLGVLCLGAPIVILFASLPLALGQALTAIADIGDVVAAERPA